MPDQAIEHSAAGAELPAPVSKLVPATLEQMAESHAEELGVCMRPLAVQRWDTQTGHTQVVPIPCGATRADVCPACADKARKLRMQQAREGWHLTEEPQVQTMEPTAQQRGALGDLAELAEARAIAESTGDTHAQRSIDEWIDETEERLAADGLRGEKSSKSECPSGTQRTVRSTRRRQDVPDLPRRKVADRTTGRAFTAPDGTVYRPSTFLTLTLDSYGPVHSASDKPKNPKVCRCGTVHHPEDGIVGTPLDPATYDYQRAARDAIHFGALADRFWTNLRRATGVNAQYFAAVEPQKRLAMHLHAAVRGTFPRKLIKQVVEATYHQVWWPEHDHPLYTAENSPVWDDDHECYRDPTTGRELSTWDDAIEATLDPDAEPAHVVRFGSNGVDVQGVDAGGSKAGKCLGYLVKYITKQLDSCYETDTHAQQAHLDRLTEALRWEPCSEGCANWLLHGIQPKNATEGLVPGVCKGKAHRPENLGYRGRRCLVSRKWSGYNLTEHRQHRREHVKKVLGAVGSTPEYDTEADPDGTRYRWKPLQPEDPKAPNRIQLLLQSLAQRRRWRREYEQARDGPNFRQLSIKRRERCE